MKERRSNSIEARYAALLASKRCLEMICEDRRLENRFLLSLLRACTGEEADNGINTSKFRKAVKRARKFLKPYSVIGGNEKQKTAPVSKKTKL